MSKRSVLLFPLLLASAVVVSCGGSTPSAKDPSSNASASDAPSSTSNGSSTPQPSNTVHECGNSGTVHAHDLSDTKVTEALTPCSANGKNDYSGLIKIETIPEGVHITIDATDDEVNAGVLGSDVKTRDAVIVYPKGKGSKAIEVPLIKTSAGYIGDKIVLWEDLDKLTDEGTKIDVAIYDHDSKSGEASEEMHVSVSVSTGKSCERARDENPDTLDIGGKNGTPDLTDAQLGAPMKTSAFFASCGLADSANAKICVTVKNGKPLGVSVDVTPSDNRVAACIDRATRKLQFPKSAKVDVVHQSF